MITPNGSAPWVKDATHETYGGHEDKEDYQAQGVTNPLTDVSAAQFTRAVADLASAQRTAAFATLTVRLNDAAPAAPTIQAIDQMTGNRIVSYEGDAAPAGFPSGSRNGDANITLQWDATYADEYGVSAALQIRHVLLGAQGSVFALPNYEIVDDRTIRVHVFDDAGLRLLDATVTVEIAT